MMNNYFYLIFITLVLYSCNTQKSNSLLSERKINALKGLGKNEIKDSIVINPPYFIEPTSSSKKPNYLNINCLFATDRNLVNKNARPSFGAERSQSGIHYGYCNVSIPMTHEIGEIESPSILKFEWNEDPNKHITILSVNTFKKQKFFDEFKNNTDSNYKKNAYIFVHGYNVSFELAAKRTAQLYKDFTFKGTPVFYSWPSQNNPIQYSVDEVNNEWSTDNFRQFLSDFLANDNIENVYLVAHSMGNRLMINALKTVLNNVKIDKYKIKEIILVAPDFDTDIFQRDYASYLTNYKIPVTLYVSSSDRALLASKIVHGNNRVGYISKKPFIFPGIETIDATKANTDFLGHSYYGNSRSVTDDIFYLINNHLRADRRRLIKKIANNKIYWEFY